ncbi:MAG: hypothetical protein FWE31_02910 [Firmicutes bacterium]|nr:hypothetical protein [Bacillota bacterium]
MAQNVFMDDYGNLIHKDDKGKFIGRTHFSPRMFRDAIQIAAGRVDGVDHVCSDRWFRAAHWTRFLFRRNGSRGGVAIKKVDYTKLVIFVCVSVRQGYSSADIAYRVQEAVLDVACNKRLTDKKIKRVDVTICSVLPQKADKACEVKCE